MPTPYNNASNTSIYDAYKTGVKRMGVLNTNLQNINTTGYKSINPDSVLFGDVLRDSIRDEEQGPLMKTDEKYDLALDIPGAYFLVEGENGPERTRDGHFHLSEEGELINSMGENLVVLDRSGEAMKLHMTEDVDINYKGEIFAQGEYKGRIAIDYEYKLPGENAKILQGKLEGSNVDLNTISMQILQSKRYIDTMQNMMSMGLAAEKGLFETYGRNV